MKENFTYKTLDVDLEKKEKTQDFLPFFQNFARTGKLVGNFKNSRLCTNPPGVLEIEVVSYFWLF